MKFNCVQRLTIRNVWDLKAVTCPHTLKLIKGTTAQIWHNTHIFFIVCYSQLIFNQMTNTDVIKKLIGNINPIGETNTDNERFENLKEMCDLVNNLITDIDDMAYRNRNSHEFSVKRASEYASEFLTKTVGISE